MLLAPAALPTAQTQSYIYIYIYVALYMYKYVALYMYIYKACIRQCCAPQSMNTESVKPLNNQLYGSKDSGKGRGVKEHNKRIIEIELQ